MADDRAPDLDNGNGGPLVEADQGWIVDEQELVDLVPGLRSMALYRPLGKVADPILLNQACGEGPA